MTLPKIFVTRRFPRTGLNLLYEHCDVHLWEDDLPPPYEVILNEISQVEGILSMLTDTVDTQVIQAGTHLKVISNYAVGYDNIDVATATQHGIPVGNTPGVLTESSADLAFALILAAARRIVEAEKYVLDGKWKTWHPTELLGQDVHGKTLGIVGFGRIGQAVARRATGFGMQIVYTGGSRAADVAEELGAEPVTFDDLLEMSDFVSVHVPLNDQTKHIIGTRELSIMKPTAILVNTSRGGTIDSEALYYALRHGEILSAALDVTDPEPIPMDSPLLTLENCLIVPHIASASWGTREQMGMMAAQNLLAGLRGEQLPFCVNPEVYD